MAAVTAGQADIGFFAINPQRAGGGILFTAPCVLIEGADLVRQDSPLTDNAQGDRPGTRIMVGKCSAFDLGKATVARGTAVAARCAGDSAWVVSWATACRPIAARRRWWRAATASCRWTQAAAAC